jgi:PIN domain nuclease of toxin-antitoxin system
LNLLLDTHAFLWWIAGDTALSRTARAAIGGDSNAVFVSAASAWGSLPSSGSASSPVSRRLPLILAPGSTRRDSFHSRSRLLMGEAAGALPGPLKDPFDRLLIAQAILDRMVLVSNEQDFGAYGVRRIW